MAIKMPLPQFGELSCHPVLYIADGFKPFGTLMYREVVVVFRDFNVETLHLICRGGLFSLGCKIAKTLPGGFQQSLVLF